MIRAFSPFRSTLISARATQLLSTSYGFSSRPDRFDRDSRPPSRGRPRYNNHDGSQMRSDSRYPSRDQPNYSNEERPHRGGRERFRDEPRQSRDKGDRRPPREYYQKEEKSEPAWGHYDGDHLYGITPVSIAINSTRRDIKELLIQEGMDLKNKKDKGAAANIIEVAQKKNIPIREFSKHDLNMITDNKVHQGFVLRAEPLEFVKCTHLEPSDKFSCVLALDEVWDPMNFGALVRTSYFLGVDKIVICSKNSAPLTPTVSKASAGAVELVTIYSTNNMMKFLDKSIENGWQVVGADLGANAVPLEDFSAGEKPTIVVLGNEGHGIRTNMLKRCTSLVRIGKQRSTAETSESSDDITIGEEGSDDAVDSLNVSVTGGIILHHLLSKRK